MFILQMSRLQTDDKSPFVTLGRVLLVLLCLSTVWVTYEMFTLTEDERISAATEAFFQAVEDEDEATVNVLLLEPFDFSGPAPIRAGDRTQMFEGLTRLWGIADGLDYVDRPPEIRIAKRSASHTSEGIVRFTWNQSLVVQRAKIEVTLIKGAPGVDDPEEWRIRRVDVLELRRGVF
jgi:hypothetical protein